VLDRLHQPCRLDELVENILQNVVRVVDVDHPFPDEVPQPMLFSRERVGDSPVFGHRFAGPQDVIHLSM
jgi:hypothetical protein